MGFDNRDNIFSATIYAYNKVSVNQKTNRRLLCLWLLNYSSKILFAFLCCHPRIFVLHVGIIGRIYSWFLHKSIKDNVLCHANILYTYKKESHNLKLTNDFIIFCGMAFFCVLYLLRIIVFSFQLFNIFYFILYNYFVFIKTHIISLCN